MLELRDDIDDFMTTQPQAGPIHGGDHWRQACADRHWHLYADEVTGKIDDPSPPRLELDGRPEQAVARSPEDVLAWLRSEIDRVAPRVASRWTAGLDRVRGATLTDIHLATVSWGKGTGIGVRISDTQSLRLLAVAAGSKTELPGQVACTKPHNA